MLVTLNLQNITVKNKYQRQFSTQKGHTFNGDDRRFKFWSPTNRLTHLRWCESVALRRWSPKGRYRGMLKVWGAFVSRNFPPPFDVLLPQHLYIYCWDMRAGNPIMTCSRAWNQNIFSVPAPGEYSKKRPLRPLRAVNKNIYVTCCM